MVAKRISALLAPIAFVLLLAMLFTPGKALAAEYELNVVTSPSGAGEVIVSYGGSWQQGSSHYDPSVSDTEWITVEAKPYAGWHCTGFELSDGRTDTPPMTSFSISKSTTVLVEFEEDAPTTYAVQVECSSGGSINCSEIASTYATSQYAPSIEEGTYLEFDAIPDEGYSFTCWVDQYDGIISFSPWFSTYLYSDYFARAEFEKDPEPLYYVYLDIDDPSGGWVSGHMNSGFAGDWVTIDATPATGYVFAGWTETGTGFPVSPDHDYTFPIYSDQYYTAHFKAEDAPITIITQPGEGSGVMPDYTVTDGETFYLPECTYTAPYGKEFDEWDVGPVGTGIEMHSDMTITALWKDKTTYTVHVEPNGGTGYMPDPECEYGEVYELPECDFTAPAGKVFDGWDVGNPGETITIYGETWFYAQWKDEDPEYLVYIDPNGGTGYMPDPYIKGGTNYTLPECDFTAPTGKEFDGWDVGKPGEQITVNSDMNIYAQWKDIAAPAPEPTPTPTPAPTPEPTPAPTPTPSSGSSASVSASSTSASSSSSTVSTGTTSSSASAASGQSGTTSGQSSAGSSGQGSGTAASGGFDLGSMIVPILAGVIAFLIGIIIILLVRRNKKDK